MGMFAKGRGAAGAAARPSFSRDLAAAAALAMLVSFTAGASAQSPFRPRLSLDAFGTFGLVHSSEGQADFVETWSRPEGAGHTNSLDLNTDSRLAGQATIGFGSRLTAVLQAMVEQAVDGDYTPHVEWANVSYAFSPDFRVRGGRIVLPVFMVSDARKVSYANPWMRPPVELYSMVPIYSLDGVDFTLRTRLGEWTGTLNGAFGGTDAKFKEGEVEAKDSWIVNTRFERGPFTARLGLASGMLYHRLLAPLFDAFRAFGPEGVAIADRYDPSGRAMQFASLGIEYDPGSWFTIAEMGWNESNSVYGERLGGYMTSGVRRGAFTSYATYSRVALLSEKSSPGLSVDGLPPEYAGMAAALNAGLNAALASPAVQQTVAVGGRWDFRQGIAFKAQLDFVDVLDTSSGTFINQQPGFEPGGSARLFSVATVFVF